MLALMLIYRRIPRVLRMLVPIILALYFFATIIRVSKAVHLIEMRRTHAHPTSTPY
ncbi:hypothetical protein HDF12_004535 [Edaphobacter lichenicola]|uniref:Uncharacterized protein n=1 Tax=Tunturiibacter lichenicola TaxID=2051959 RepID=A0A7Y9NSF1_9BACT|nr:hypothetical protein [Edaphobacter lichenicola]